MCVRVVYRIMCGVRYTMCVRAIWQGMSSLWKLHMAIVLNSQAATSGVSRGSSNPKCSSAEGLSLYEWDVKLQALTFGMSFLVSVFCMTACVVGLYDAVVSRQKNVNLILEVAPGVRPSNPKC